MEQDKVKSAITGFSVQYCGCLLIGVHLSFQKDVSDLQAVHLAQEVLVLQLLPRANMKPNQEQS